MELSSNEIDIINSEIAKLRQANIEFDEKPLAIDVHDGFSSNPVEACLGVGDRLLNDVNVLDLTLASTFKLDCDKYNDNPETVGSLGLSLALNRKCQSQVASLLSVISIALEENKKRQICQAFNEMDQEIITAKKKTVSLFCKPYFKDLQRSFPKPNDETIARKASLEIDGFTRPKKSWSIEDNEILLNSVKNDYLQRKLRPLMNRKEIELKKFKNAIEGTTEYQSFEDNLKSIDQTIKDISCSKDSLHGNLDEIEDVDWMKIVTIDLKERRTVQDCKNFWVNVAHPDINKLKWTSEEDANLVKLAKQTNGRRWNDIAQQLGTKRSAFLCLQRYQSKFNPIIHIKWSTSDDKKLERLVNGLIKKRGGINWNRAAKLMGSRTAYECEFRWNRLKPKKRTKWGMDLDKKLCEAVNVFGCNWIKVAKFVPGKNSLQCRDRYKNSLDKSLKIGSWSKEEDVLLWKAIKIHGLEGQWAKICHTFLPHRTDNQILMRCRRLVNFDKQSKRGHKKKVNQEITADSEAKDSNEIFEAPEKPVRPGKRRRQPRKKLQEKDDDDDVSIDCEPSSPDNVGSSSPYSTNIDSSSSHNINVDSPINRPYSLRNRLARVPYSLRNRSTYVMYDLPEVNMDFESDSDSEEYVSSDDDDDDDDYDDDDYDDGSHHPSKRIRLDEIIHREIHDIENIKTPNPPRVKTSTNFRGQKENIYDKEIIDVLAQSIRKKHFVDEYKSKQKSKPGFNVEIETKFENLLGNALQLPVSNKNLSNPINVPLLPPSRSSLSAFEKLMNNRQELTKTAKLFQFPNNTDLPPPWDRTQVEKFVGTSRIFGNMFLSDPSKANSRVCGDLLFKEELVAADEIPSIEDMKTMLLNNRKESHQEPVTKHCQASRMCRTIKSSDEYQNLQQKFILLFCWPLLLNHSMQEK